MLELLACLKLQMISMEHWLWCVGKLVKEVQALTAEAEGQLKAR